MANLQEVRNRIASVSSTQQITSAMKMVSASKFRKAQNAIIGMRPYADELSEIVKNLGSSEDVVTPYHQPRTPNRVLLVVITSNKGLCGAFNANVIKEANARIEHLRNEKNCESIHLITIGKKATEFFSKTEGLVLESHDELVNKATFDEVTILTERLMQDFLNKIYDRIEIIYNQFKNSLTQIVKTEQFLPIQPSEGTEASVHNNNYIFEPSKEVILKEMVPMTLRSHFYRIILDSLASEHGARMNAMQKATDNATELLKHLKLSYNKARQASITNEIIEIVSGSEALKG